MISGHNLSPVREFMGNQVEIITSVIRTIRGQKVILDSDLARIYGVDTGALNRAVSRNRRRFPSDFIFQLSSEEFENLKCQLGISSSHGGRQQAALRLHRAWRHHGRQRTQQPGSCADERVRGANVHPDARIARQQQGVG
jgi:hypothetical protein